MQIKSLKRLCALATVILVLFFLVCTVFHTHETHLPSGDSVCLLCLLRNTSFLCFAVLVSEPCFFFICNMLSKNKGSLHKIHTKIKFYCILCDKIIR